MNYDLLNGLRVIESSAFVAAPLCGMSLAQLGADVIRVDLIGGGIDYRRLPLMPGGRSLYWTSLNKAKRSVALDIRRPQGRELLAQLVGAPGEQGGVLLTNLGSPWLSHAALQGQRPDLISCTIEGNQDGSSAVDYTINCATGYPALTGHGSPDSPVNHVLPAWDVICAHQAASAIIAASARRQRSGQGAEIRLALADCAFSTLSHLSVLTEAQLLEEERHSLGNHLYGAFGHDFGTADGRRVMIAAISLKQWQALVAASGLKAPIAALETSLGLDFSSEADRFEGRELIAALLKRWCQQRSLAQIRDCFDPAGVCWGLYNSVRQLLRDDPRVSTRNPIFQQVDTPGVGQHLAAGTALRFAGHKRQVIRPAPQLGQHTDEVLAEVLGLSSQQIGLLHDAGVIAGPGRE